MEYRAVADSGLEVSTVGLGTVDFGDRLDESAAQELVSAALHLGINLLDTGDNYAGGRSEEILGRVIKGRRNEVIVSTKFTGRDRFRADGSRRHVIEACEGSLRRLGIDCIDLYTMHHPDPDTPIEETLAALTQLVQEGKVRSLGSSNFFGWQVAEAEHTAMASAGSRFVACQMEWNLLKRHVEDEIVAACRHYDVSIMPFYPIASGLLTGKYTRERAFPSGSRLADVDFYARVASAENFEKVEKLTAFAEQRGHTILDLAMSWLSGQVGVSSVLVGASSADQLRRNASAVGWKLTEEDREAVDALLEEIRNPGEVPFNKLPAA
jgi:aryl-alcohol dehydrogenase-like predicted oxidoreductase